MRARVCIIGTLILIMGTTEAAGTPWAVGDKGIGRRHVSVIPAPVPYYLPPIHGVQLYRPRAMFNG